MGALPGGPLPIWAAGAHSGRARRLPGAAPRVRYRQRGRTILYDVTQ